MHNRKNLVLYLVPISIALAITVIVACVAFKQNQPVVYQPIDPVPAATETPVQEPQHTHLEGTIICLEHKEHYAPTTDECVIGVQTPDSKEYALDTNLLQSTTVSVLYSPGNTISANGILTPIEFLSTDKWQQYNIQGIFSVTDSTELVNNTP